MNRQIKAIHVYSNRQGYLNNKKEYIMIDLI